MRFAVAADAVALLADPARIARLHRCPGRDCGWVFLDTSGRRRWCSMATCGSREKMRRMYARKRAAERTRHPQLQRMRRQHDRAVGADQDVVLEPDAAAARSGRSPARR